MWTLTKWLEVATFSDWLMESYLPYIKVAWPEIVMWCLAMFVPGALTFSLRLGMEQVLKAWLPWDIAGLFRKDKYKK